MRTNSTTVVIDDSSYNVSWNVDDGLDDGAHTEVGVWHETYGDDSLPGRYVVDLPDAHFWTDDLDEAVAVYVARRGSSVLDTELIRSLEIKE
jgi:hypothetical protein